MIQRSSPKTAVMSITTRPSSSSSSSRQPYAWLRPSLLVVLILMLGLVAMQVSEMRSIACSNTPSSSSTNNNKSADTQTKTSNGTSPPPPSTALAFQDSLGFFHNIPDALWKERRRIARARPHHAFPDQILHERESPKAWYQTNWEPTLTCLNENMLGNMGDGHKWVCDPKRIEEQSRENLANDNKNERCLVYSIGSSGQFDFERDVQKYMPSCEIHTFDFTNFQRHMPPGLNISYHVWGLKASYDEEDMQLLIPQKGFGANFATPLWRQANARGIFKTIQETMEELGHAGRTVNIFKIDCEGCEWFSYKDWISPKIDIRQIQVEVHDAPLMIDDFFQSFFNAGFAMFHKEPNIQYADGNCVEFSFLKMAPSFFGTEEEREEARNTISAR